MKTCTIIFSIIDCILIVYGLSLGNKVFEKRQKLEITTESGLDIPSRFYIWNVSIATATVLAVITFMIVVSLLNLQEPFRISPMVICSYKGITCDLTPIISLFLLILFLYSYYKQFKSILKNPSS